MTRKIYYTDEHDCSKHRGCCSLNRNGGPVQRIDISTAGTPEAGASVEYNGRAGVTWSVGARQLGERRQPVMNARRVEALMK